MYQYNRIRGRYTTGRLYESTGIGKGADLVALAGL